MVQKVAEIKINQVINFLIQELDDLPDARKPGNNTKYEISDAMMAAFSLFFTQSPSFLEPEFIKKQDGNKKQDCENAAVKRWLTKNPQKQYDNPVTLLGDDLYSRQPICKLALNQNYNFIFVCRPTSHKTLYEWLEFLDKSGEVNTLQNHEFRGRNKIIYFYKYVNKIPIIDGDDSLQVNWCEVTVLNETTQEIIYKNNWMTNHNITNNNVLQIVKAGRSRWKIENESNNVLKNHGYNLEHNFGHGQEQLCEILLTLNLLAFLFHSALALANSTYQKIRQLLGSRRSFFNDLRTLLKYFWFPTWSDLLSFMLDDNPPPSTANSS